MSNFHPYSPYPAPPIVNNYYYNSTYYQCSDVNSHSHYNTSDNEVSYTRSKKNKSESNSTNSAMNNMCMCLMMWNYLKNK